MRRLPPCWYFINLSQPIFSLATAITQKFFKTFAVKQEKLDAIMLIAQSKLDSIADIILQIMKDRDISSIEFHKVLWEVEEYCKLWESH